MTRTGGCPLLGIPPASTEAESPGNLSCLIHWIKKHTGKDRVQKIEYWIFSLASWTYQSQPTPYSFFWKKKKKIKRDNRFYEKKMIISDKKILFVNRKFLLKKTFSSVLWAVNFWNVLCPHFLWDLQQLLCLGLRDQIICGTTWVLIKWCWAFVILIKTNHFNKDVEKEVSE